MKKEKSKFNAMGFYVAIALIIYALIGALANDIYLPGRRSRGLHLHYDAIAPALLAITLFAVTLPLEYLRDSRWIRHARTALLICAGLSMLAALYAVIKPAGKELATVNECRVTITRITEFTKQIAGDGAQESIDALFAQRQSECDQHPILKTYHDCVASAQKPNDLNRCGDMSERLFQRRNAS